MASVAASDSAVPGKGSEDAPSPPAVDVQVDAPGDGGSREATPTTKEEEPVSVEPPEVIRQRELAFNSLDGAVRNVCESNGITKEKFVRGARSILALELFFFNMKRIEGLNQFVGLKELCIVVQDLEKIDGLDNLVVLEKLWICETKVSEMRGLSKLTNLRKLYMYANRITAIAGLATLTKLDTLWLFDNCIQAIEGLETLTNLVELDLSRNNISKIGNSLRKNVNLEMLHLSDNRISFFRDILDLAPLSRLRSLRLFDAHWDGNPVCKLANYTTFVLHHLSNLTSLDTQDVSDPAVRQQIETTFSRKAMYYSMRISTLRRNSNDVIAALEKEAMRRIQSIRQGLAKVYFQMRSIERELEDRNVQRKDPKTDPADPADRVIDAEKLRTKLKALRTRVDNREGEIQSLLNVLDRQRDHVNNICEVNARRLLIELGTGGNTQFEDGTPQEAWFSSCAELLQLRYTPTDQQVALGVASKLTESLAYSGVRVTRVTRIHSRPLRNAFDEKLENLFGGDIGRRGLNPAVPSPMATQAHKRFLEYCFFCWDPKMGDQMVETLRVCEFGFRTPHEYAAFGVQAGIPLTNSVNIAEVARLSSVMGSTLPAKADVARRGHLVIVKACFAKVSTLADGASIVPDKYGDSDCLMRVRHEDGCKERAIQPPPGKPNVRCKCRHREWFLLDPDLALPEYIVDFEYVGRGHSTDPSPYASVHVATASSEDKEQTSGGAQSSSDGTPRPKDVDRLRVSADSSGANSAGSSRSEVGPPPATPLTSIESEDNTGNPNVDVLELAPALKGRQKLVALSEDAMLRISGASWLSGIQSLNLHACGLARLEGLGALTTIKKLVVCFNRLTSIDGIAALPTLEYLDLGHNKIRKVDGIKGLVNLRHFDVSSNQLRKGDDLRTIRACLAPSLTWLDTRHNLFHEDGIFSARSLLVGKMKQLEVLDGVPVTAEEKGAAASGTGLERSPIAMATLRTVTALGDDLPRALWLPLSLEMNHNSCIQPPPEPDPKPDSQSHVWLTKVTCVDVSGLGLRQFGQFLESVPLVRWLRACNNRIKRIDGIERTPKVEELNLDHNELTKVDGLAAALPRLRKLSIGNNRLSSLEGMSSFANLTLLSVEGNGLRTIAGVEQLVCLSEFYAGNNHVANLKEVYRLKPLSRLAIVDLFGNPMSAESEYRAFVIYHLSRLRVLDGVGVETGEHASAADTYGGRLNADLLAERLGTSNMSNVAELDLPSLGLREVASNICECDFSALRSLNLEHNNLVSFGGLIYLPNVRVLCLNQNRIQTVVDDDQGLANQLLPTLEVLHLGYNNIKSLANLGLGRLRSLRCLFLQGNDLTRVDGLEGLSELRELVLDRNKIRGIDPQSFVHQTHLRELHIEDNRLKSLSHLWVLNRLQRLYLGLNRVHDMRELDKLEPLRLLAELSMVSNPVARKQMYRPTLVFLLRALLCLDGSDVTPEERTRADHYFLDQMGDLVGGTAVTNYLPSVPAGQRTLSSVPMAQASMQASIGRGLSGQTIQDNNAPDLRQASYGNNPVANISHPSTNTPLAVAPLTHFSLASTSSSSSTAHRQPQRGGGGGNGSQPQDSMPLGNARARIERVYAAAGVSTVQTAPRTTGLHHLIEGGVVALSGSSVGPAKGADGDGSKGRQKQ